MSKIKLYTEEQVRKAYFEGWNDGQHENIGYIDTVVDSLTPIELPSDEEINNQIAEELTGFDESDGAYEYSGGFEYGAKWVIEKIKQQVIP